MIKAIIFDFDGVILESTEVKIDAFRELFCGYPDRLKEVLAYHIEQGGISRFVKFRYIYKNILKKELTKEQEAELGRKFTELALDKVLKVPYVPGAKEFLEKKRSQYKFFIASGTPDAELNEVITRRKMGKYFDGVYGSPETKSDIIRKIRKDHRLDKEEIVFIGDANSDRQAARDADIEFVYRVHDDNLKTGDTWVVKDLTNIEKIIEKIEQTKRAPKVVRS